MPSPFELATSVEPLSPGHFRADIPDGWQQGRGVFGGLVLGVLARAILASEPDEHRTLRSLSGDICGPVLAGAATVDVTVLRRGNNLTNLDARLLQDGGVAARASAVLSSPRAPDLSAQSFGSPPRPDWQSVDILPVRSPVGPMFARHYEFRTTGPKPFSKGTEAAAAGYVREAVTPSKLDVPGIIGLLDAHWPTFFSVWQSPRPIATVGFTAEILADLTTLDPATPLFYVARLMALREGFFVEFRELWSGDHMVAMNQQTFAIIK